MKQVISPEYAALNKQLHAEREDYGNGGEDGAPHVINLCQDNGYAVILDWGCGKGGLKRAIKLQAPRLRVLEFDPAVHGKDVLPQRQPDRLPP